MFFFPLFIKANKLRQLFNSKGVVVSCAAVFPNCVSQPAAIEMGIAGTFPMNIGIPSMVLYHVFIGIIEAVLTVIVLAALDKFRPDLLAWNEGDAKNE